MARVEHTRRSVPSDTTGYNYTDTAHFSTLTPGSNNGVKFPYADNQFVILKNPTGGDAVFTLVVGYTPPNYSAMSITVTSPTITVAAGKDHFVRVGDVFKNANDSNKVSIDCDVAGQVLVMTLG